MPLVQNQQAGIILTETPIGTVCVREVNRMVTAKMTGYLVQYIFVCSLQASMATVGYIGLANCFSFLWVCQNPEER